MSINVSDACVTAGPVQATIIRRARFPRAAETQASEHTHPSPTGRAPEKKKAEQKKPEESTSGSVHARKRAAAATRAERTSCIARRAASATFHTSCRPAPRGLL